MINASNITSISAVVTWSAPEFPNGMITEYRITINSQGGVPTMHTASGEVMSFNVTRLVPFTEYSVSVRGVTDGGPGESGPSWNFTTLEDSESDVCYHT